MEKTASGSPPSSMRETRIEEKQELQGLNDRLETYVAHTRSLRAALEAKEKELDSTRKNMDRHVAALQAEFGVQLDKLRNELMQAASDAAAERDHVATLEAELVGVRSQLADVKALQAERTQLRARLEQAENGAKTAQQRADAAEKAAKHERSASARLAGDLKEATTELASARGLISTIQGELAALKTAYEAATEGANDTIRREVAKQRAAWDKLHAEKLEKLERDLRAEYDAELAELKGREDALLLANDRLRKDVARATADASSRQDFANSLVKRIAELEEAHKLERLDWERSRAKLEDVVAKALRDLAVKTEEFNSLMDVKISLQAEITHYRRILELEEKRTGLTPVARKVARRVDSNGVMTTTASSGSWLSMFGLGRSPAPKSAPVEDVAENASEHAAEEAAEERAALVAAPEPAKPTRGRGGRRRSSVMADASAPAAAPAAAAGRKRRHAEPEPAPEPEAAADGAAGLGLEDGPSYIDNGAGDVELSADYDYGATMADAAEATEAAEASADGAASEMSSPTRSGRRGRRYPVRKHKREVGHWITRSMEAAGISDKSVFSPDDFTMRVSLEDDHVTVDNKLSVEMDLTGWSLLSEVGDQRFVFPDGFKIPPGGSVTVWSGPNSASKENFPTDLVWSDKYVWNSRGDTAVLYDADGHEVSREVGVPGAVAETQGKDGNCVIM